MPTKKKTEADAEPEAVTPDAAAPPLEPTADEIAAVEAAADLADLPADDTAERDTEAQADIAPDGYGPGERDEQRDPARPPKPVDIATTRDQELARHTALRTNGSGPQTVEGYTPPAPPSTGKPPLGFNDDAFTLRTGPTAPSVVDQQALTAVANHFPDEFDSGERPDFHDAD